ncbi:hypothetical protein BJ165DRAFT_1610428 [Panaeolus papilionaceus]|nr:hypothetical protein BJ165DRAFT_1610428 [Panaeolus papilionaceus]
MALIERYQPLLSSTTPIFQKTKTMMVPDTPARDDMFYSELIPVIFKVENTLFRVLRDELLHPGSFFETLFSLPQPQLPAKTTGDNAEVKPGLRSGEGKSDDHPIVLEGISARAFRNFLRAIYPSQVRKIVTPCTTCEEWFDVLELSIMWDFTDIRRRSILELSPFVKTGSVNSQIVLAERHRVKSWLVSALSIIAASPDSIPIEELKTEGVKLETIYLLAVVQARWLSKVFQAIMAEKEEVAKCYRCDQSHCGANITSLDTDECTKPFRQPPAEEIEDLVKDVFKHVLQTFSDE